jgi:MFS family permease
MEKQKPKSRRSIFLNLGLFQFLSFMRRGVFYTFMINYLYGLMQAVTFTALFGTLDMMASALGQNLLWGRISDRYQLRTRLIIAGESTAALAYLIVYLIHRSLIDTQANFAAGLALIIGLSSLEFFWSMSDVGWAALLTDVSTPETRGRIVGVLGFVASLGRMIGIIFSGFLYNDGQGFRQGTIFYIVIAMLLTGAVIMWLTPKSTVVLDVERGESVESKVEEEPRENYNDEIYRWFLASLIIIIIGAACISQVFLLFLKLPSASGGLGASDEGMSLILTGWTVGGMMASLLSGWLADRFGRISVLFIGLALAVVTPLSYGLAPSVLTMTLLYGLNGVSFWIIQTVGFAFAGDTVPREKRGRFLGRYNAVMALSWGPAGLLIGGPLADAEVRSGLSSGTAYVNTFYVSSIIVAFGLMVFVLKVARVRRKPPKS